MPLTKKELKNIPRYDLGDLFLRPVEESDYLDMYDYGKNDEVTKMLSWTSFKEPLEAKGAIQKFFLTRPENHLPSAHAIIHKASNKMIGTCDFPSIDWTNKTATLGYCMHSAYWGKGYMTKVVKQVLDFAFDYLGMETIRVQHHPNNIGSKRVIEKVGFVYQKQSYNPSLKMELPTYVIQKNRASIS